MKYRGKRPMEWLKESVEQKIEVKLKDDTVYKGNLVDIDWYMNIILGSATEYFNVNHASLYLFMLIYLSI